MSSTNTEISALKVERKSGAEQFEHDGKPTGPTVLDFWQWMGSDLVNNTMRGVLAEFIVAQALGVAEGVRTEWDAYDLKTPSGAKVEVKSAAYCQSWKQEKPSQISFGIQPTHGWNAETNETSEERRRQADVYVFCVLKHKDKATLDPMNLDQWDFYVLPTRVLNEILGAQETLALSSLLKLNPEKADFASLGDKIACAAIQ